MSFCGAGVLLRARADGCGGRNLVRAAILPSDPSIRSLARARLANRKAADGDAFQRRGDTDLGQRVGGELGAIPQLRAAAGREPGVERQLQLRRAGGKPHVNTMTSDHRSSKHARDAVWVLVVCRTKAEASIESLGHTPRPSRGDLRSRCTGRCGVSACCEQKAEASIATSRM